MIKGTPAVVEEVELLLRLRHRAATNPAWQGLSSGIRTRRSSNGTIMAGFDPSHPGAGRAYELEFGTPDDRPQSVFRSVIGAHPRAGMDRWWEDG